MDKHHIWWLKFKCSKYKIQDSPARIATKIFVKYVLWEIKLCVSLFKERFLDLKFRTQKLEKAWMAFQVQSFI